MPNKKEDIYPLGCILEQDDPRNFAYQRIAGPRSLSLPEVVEAPVLQFNQGKIDSCVGHAVANQKSAQEGAELSPRFLWSLTKRDEDYYGWGTGIVRCLKMLQKYGVPKLSSVPEDPTLPRNEYMKIADNVGPEIYTEAAKHKSTSFWYIYKNDQDLVTQALHDEKIPLVTSMMWYKGYNRPDENGFLPKPIQGQEAGGHAFVIYKKERIGTRVKCTFRNTWGANWGDNGDFHVWEDEITSIYKMGTFFVTVDVPKDRAYILNTYNGQLVKNPGSPKVYFIWNKEIIWIEDPAIFNLLKNRAWGDWNSILTIPEKIDGTKRFDYSNF